MILDLLPTVARLYFSGRIGSVHVPRLQAGILLSLGLQHGTLDNVASQLNIGTNQVLALFNKVMRKVSMCLNSIVEKKAEEDFEKRIGKHHSTSKSEGGEGGGSNESKTKSIKAFLKDTSIQRDFAVPTSVIHGSGAIRASSGSGSGGGGNKRKRMESGEGTTTEKEAYSGRVDLMKKKV
jgi:hypothetical protein